MSKQIKSHSRTAFIFALATVAVFLFTIKLDFLPDATYYVLLSGGSALAVLGCFYSIKGIRENSGIGKWLALILNFSFLLLYCVIVFIIVKGVH